MKELEEIEARANAATEGPWSDLGEPGELHSCVMADHGGDPFHVALHVKRKHDLEFLSHARTDVPRLVKALKYVMNTYYDYDENQVQRILRGEE